MAQGKNIINVYRDWISIFDKLSNEEAGVLIKHFFRYVNDLNPEPPDRITELCFEPIKQQLKRDLIKWEKICERNKNNGLKGGRPINPEEPKEPSGLFKNPKNPNEPDKDKDTDKDKEIIKDIILFLNEKTQKDFKPNTKKTIATINARLSEGFMIDDFKKVIDIKVNKWLNDPKMRDYLRPETLFGTKFESYLNEVPKQIVRPATSISNKFQFVEGWKDERE